MRYIDLAELSLPDGWYERAQAASDAVASGADPNDYGGVWRDLKDNMEAIFPSKKCWYCESIVDRADNAVDHFRPKNRVADAKNPHDGYRWLAFVKENYRYACTICNSKRKDIAQGTDGGKADLFPLQDETKRAYCCTDNIEMETPILLDPCDPFDWKLIGCKRENGKSCAASTNPQEVYRATESIGIYHLNYSATTNRRHSVAVAFLSEVEETKRQFEKVQEDPAAESDFKRVAAKVRRAIDRKSPHSGEMIYLLKLQRDDAHPWVQDIIDA